MSRARFWKLQINLDTFNAAYAALDGALEQAEFLAGLYRGMNGGKVKDDCSDPMSVGFAIGSEMRQEAEGFRMAASINGSKRKSNENYHPVNLVVDQTVDHVGHPIQYPISNNLIPTNEKSEKAPSPSRARSSAKKDEIPPIPEDALPFLEDLSSRWYKKSHDGRRVTRLTPTETWKRIHKNREQDTVGVCINAGLYYLELDDNRYAIGMDNFFGKERKYTRYVVE